ncbi:phytanoyl-CoA dioxygenase family protein [Flavobacteriaceae bacterium]|nr:phytanoyl-CoA dioxygenase family protein [Flavobacteriaceae bacterium]
MKQKIDFYSKKLNQDGFVHIDGLFSSLELRDIVKAIEDNMNSPSPFGKTMKSEKGGDFFMDFNSWKRLDSIKEVCFNDKIVKLVTSLTKSKKCWLFHDHILVKSGPALATPIHHDRPYYVFDGNLNVSVWITADDVKKESSLVFYKNSHKSEELYIPRSFNSGKSLVDKVTDDFQLIDEDSFDGYEPVDFDMKAGDAIIFFHKTVHRAKENKSGTLRRALSIRYLLDGASLTKKYVNATPPFDRMGVKIVEGNPVPEKYFPLLKS